MLCFRYENPTSCSGRHSLGSSAVKRPDPVVAAEALAARPPLDAVYDRRSGRQEADHKACLSLHSSAPHVTRYATCLAVGVITLRPARPLAQGSKHSGVSACPTLW